MGYYNDVIQEADAEILFYTKRFYKCQWQNALVFADEPPNVNVVNANIVLP